MNKDVTAPPRRKNWAMYQIVQRILVDGAADRALKAETLLDLGVSPQRIVALLNGRTR